MKTLALVALAAFLAAGCTHALGYAGANPGYIECKGKGSISATGAVAAVGGAMNNFSIVADCGDGFILQQGKPTNGPANIPKTP